MAEIKMSRVIGAYNIEVAGDDIKEVLAEMAFIGSWPNICGMCGSDVHPAHRNAKTKQGVDCEYWSLVCEQGHELNFGQHTPARGGGLFLRNRNAWQEGYGGGDVPAEDETEHTRQAAVEGGACVWDGCPKTLNSAQAKLSTTKFEMLLCPAHQAEYEKSREGEKAKKANGAAAPTAAPAQAPKPTAATAATAATAPAPPPAKAQAQAAPAPPPVAENGRKPTTEELGFGVGWVEYCRDEEYIEPAYAAELLAELHQPITLKRVLIIIEDMKNQHEAKKDSD